MIVRPDAGKEASGPQENAVQPRKNTVQAGSDGFGLVLSALGSRSGDEGGPESASPGSSSEESKAEGSLERDASAESGLPANIAAWIAQGNAKHAAAATTSAALGLGMVDALGQVDAPSGAAAVGGGIDLVHMPVSDPENGSMGGQGSLASGEIPGAPGGIGNGLAPHALALMAAINGGLPGPAVGQMLAVGSGVIGAADQEGMLPVRGSRGAAPPTTAVSLAETSAALLISSMEVNRRASEAIWQVNVIGGLAVPIATGGLVGRASPLGGVASAALDEELAQGSRSQTALPVHGLLRTDINAGEQNALRERGGRPQSASADGDARKAPGPETPPSESLRMLHPAVSDPQGTGHGLTAPALAAAYGQPAVVPAWTRETLVNASALEGSVSWLASQHGGVATMDLSPPSLGSLRLELKVDASGSHATLVVHAASDAARVAVEQALDRLYEAFQSSNMSLSVSVGTGSGNFNGYTPLWQATREDRASVSVNRQPSGHPEDHRNSGLQQVSATDMLSLYA